MCRETKDRSESISDQFWDDAYKDFDPFYVDVDWLVSKNETNKLFFSLLRGVSGKNILDLGCGTGRLSVCLSKMGASVTGIDCSKSSILNAQNLAVYNDVTSCNFHVLDAMQIEAWGQFDVVVGDSILHHIEPFSSFPQILKSVIKPEGRAIFMENSSRNRALMFCREKLVGRFGVPKYGDDQECPLSDKEINHLRREFGVQLYYPEFKFFSMLGVYIYRPLLTAFKTIDKFVWRAFPGLRKFSYTERE